MEALRLCVFLAVIVTLRAYELSKNQVEFYCTMNGNFNDTKQIETSGAPRSKIQLVIQPILALTLSDVPMLYIQEYINGVPTRSLLLNVTESDNETMFATPFNFTGNMDIKQGPVDPKVIKSLTWNDLEGQPDCKDSYVRVKPFVFFVTWEDCRDATVKGTRENYSGICTCNGGCQAQTPPVAAESNALTPYQFTRSGNKYLLENAPDNYVCNCDNPSA